MRVVREPGGREDNSEKGVGALSMPMATPHHMRATHRSTHTHAYRHASLTGRRAEASSWRAAAAVAAPHAKALSPRPPRAHLAHRHRSQAPGA